MSEPVKNPREYFKKIDRYFVITERRNFYKFATLKEAQEFAEGVCSCELYVLKTVYRESWNK
jgi:hypothetical protein